MASLCDGKWFFSTHSQIYKTIKRINLSAIPCFTHLPINSLNKSTALFFYSLKVQVLEIETEIYVW